MADIDNLEAMKLLDPSGVLASTALFAQQCQQSWEESRAIAFPDSYRQATSIIVAGMGGSRFTPATIKWIFKDRITVPYEIIDDYTLPAYVNNHTLVILSS